METIRVKDFSRFPGPRYIRLGKFSGEAFREEKLVPALKKSDSPIQVDLDGVAGYGSSFLDEAFAGLLRRDDIDKAVVIELVNNLKSDDDPLRIEEIRGYVQDQINTN